MVERTILKNKKTVTNEMSRVIHNTHYTEGWSDLALFAIFEKQQASADHVYF